jgi:hypothetical protein
MANPVAANFQLRFLAAPVPGDDGTKNLGNSPPPGPIWCHKSGGIWVFPMNKLQTAPPVGGGFEPRFHVRPARSGRAPLPWTWAIYEQGKATLPRRVSVRSYRSAEEAWEAGCAALRRLQG